MFVPHLGRLPGGAGVATLQVVGDADDAIVPGEAIEEHAGLAGFAST